MGWDSRILKKLTDCCPRSTLAGRRIQLASGKVWRPPGGLALRAGSANGTIVVPPGLHFGAAANRHTLPNATQNTGPLFRIAHRSLPAVLLATAVLLLQSPTDSMAEKLLAATPAVLPGSAENPALHQMGAPLIVVGFMGGRIHAGNLVHGEARLAKDLDQRYAGAVHAITFANRDARQALRTVLELLDTSKDGRLSDEEKSTARIVIFGHSWGASETVHFAKELNRRGIPVLLTVQVDSVEKSGEDDRNIPPNVRAAVNFFEAEGMLHGRRSIQAVDPTQTTILGSYEYSYKNNPISCAGYSWYARAFMRPHIEIENDNAVWDRIEGLIVARASAANLVGMVAAGNTK